MTGRMTCRKKHRRKRCRRKNRHPASGKTVRAAVSRATHEKLMRIVTVISGRKVTVSSYVENILLRHFEQYQDEINTLYENNFQKPV